MGMPGQTIKRIKYTIASCTCHHDGGNTVPNRPLWVLEAAYSLPGDTILTYVLGDIKACLNRMGPRIEGVWQYNFDCPLQEDQQPPLQSQSVQAERVGYDFRNSTMHLAEFIPIPTTFTLIQ